MAASARVNEQTTSYTLQPQDNAKLVVFNSSSVVTLTLPQPGNPVWLGVTFECEVSNIGTGNLTVAPASSLIDGGGSLVLTQNQGVQLFTDGTNYFTVRGTGTGGGGGSLALETNGTTNGSQTLLNLQEGTGVTITDGGSGTVTIAASGGGSSITFGSAPPTGAGMVQATTGGGFSLAFASGVTSGNLLLVAYKSEGTITSVTISDTVGTSYSLVAQISGEANNMNIYAGIAGGSGSNTVTIGGAPNNFDRLGLMEVVNATATADVTANTYSGTSPTSLPITTTYATDFIFAANAGYHNVNVFSLGGFILDAQSNGGDANAIGHLVTSSTGTYTLTVTVTTGGADNQPIILVAMKAAAPISGTEGAIYFQTSTTPYTGFVYHSGAWNQFS